MNKGVRHWFRFENVISAGDGQRVDSFNVHLPRKLNSNDLEILRLHDNFYPLQYTQNIKQVVLPDCLSEKVVKLVEKIKNMNIWDSVLQHDDDYLRNMGNELSDGGVMRDLLELCDTINEILARTLFNFDWEFYRLMVNFYRAMFSKVEHLWNWIFSVLDLDGGGRQHNNNTWMQSYTPFVPIISYIPNIFVLDKVKDYSHGCLDRTFVVQFFSLNDLVGGAHVGNFFDQWILEVVTAEMIISVEPLDGCNYIPGGNQTITVACDPTIVDQINSSTTKYGDFSLFFTLPSQDELKNVFKFTQKYSSGGGGRKKLLNNTNVIHVQFLVQCNYHDSDYNLKSSKRFWLAGDNFQMKQPIIFSVLSVKNMENWIESNKNSMKNVIPKQKIMIHDDDQTGAVMVVEDEMKKYSHVEMVSLLVAWNWTQTVISSFCQIVYGDKNEIDLINLKLFLIENQFHLHKQITTNNNTATNTNILTTIPWGDFLAQLINDGDDDGKIMLEICVEHLCELYMSLDFFLECFWAQYMGVFLGKLRFCSSLKMLWFNGLVQYVLPVANCGEETMDGSTITKYMMEKISKWLFFEEDIDSNMMMMHESWYRSSVSNALFVMYLIAEHHFSYFDDSSQFVTYFDPSYRGNNNQYLFVQYFENVGNPDYMSKLLASSPLVEKKEQLLLQFQLCGRGEKIAIKLDDFRSDDILASIFSHPHLDLWISENRVVSIQFNDGDSVIVKYPFTSGFLYLTNLMKLKNGDQMALENFYRAKNVSGVVNERVFEEWTNFWHVNLINNNNSGGEILNGWEKLIIIKCKLNSCLMNSVVDFKKREKSTIIPKYIYDFVKKGPADCFALQFARHLKKK